VPYRFQTVEGGFEGARRPCPEGRAPRLCVGSKDDRLCPRPATMRRGRAYHRGEHAAHRPRKVSPGPGEGAPGVDPDRPNYETKPFSRPRRRAPRSGIAGAPRARGRRALRLRADRRERLWPSLPAAMQDRKTAYGFAFGVLLNEDGEDGAGRLEPTKA
jgi:hypothetical protein